MTRGYRSPSPKVDGMEAPPGTRPATTTGERRGVPREVALAGRTILPDDSLRDGVRGMAKRQDVEAEGRAFGEDVLETLIWEAVEEALLALPRGSSDAWAEGLEAWGRELLVRWPEEIAGFLEAFREDEDAGRLERLRGRVREAAPRPARPMRLLAPAMAG